MTIVGQPASYGVSTAVIPEACLPTGRSVDREYRNHVALYVSGYPLEFIPYTIAGQA